MTLEVNKVLDKLQGYCESEDYKGWDPFDGLNSKVFQSLPLKKYRLTRLMWIQFFKKSPINLRKIFKVEKDLNPQGLALFISGYCKLFKMTADESYKEKIQFLSEKLIKLKTKGYSGDCWGYNFDWQARAFFQPKYSPTVVATSFAGGALLDAYDILQKKNFLEASISSSNFILNDLNKTYDDDGNYCLSYSPLDQTVVFNAGFLGAKLLSRIYNYTGEEHLVTNAEKIIIYCCAHQKSSGAWPYGKKAYHQWEDSFHTGYNLEAINEYHLRSGKNDFDIYLNKGFEYYIKNFFTDTGTPKYYSNKTYPIDINSPAQFIITLCVLKKLRENSQFAEKVLKWTKKNMWDEKGYFFYQKKRLYTIKIPYMRWSQAWMFYSLSFYLSEITNNER